MNRFWLLLLFPLSLNAQAPKLKSGMKALQRGDYVSAVNHFDGVIQNSSKQEERAEAHFHRAESYINLYHYAMRQRHEPLLHTYADAYARACEDYQRAAEINKSAWQERSANALSALFPELVHDGLKKLEAAKKEKDPGIKEDLLQNAVRCLQTAAGINPQQYLPADLLGQIAIERRQYRQAERHFRDAVVLFNQYPPETPDLLAAYSCYRLALLQRHYLNGQNGGPSHDAMREALEYLRQAKSTLEAEYRRAARMAGRLSSQDLERYQRQYGAVLQDFYFLELDLYFHLPELHGEALSRFQEAIRKEPENYTLILAYARLLEKTDIQEALAIYGKAAQLRPDDYEAHYHLGIIYVNEAARMEKEAKLTPHIDRYQQLNALSREFLAKARPHLQAAYRSRPDNLDLVNALLQVSLNLHMPEDYQQYKKRQMELGEK